MSKLKSYVDYLGLPPGIYPSITKIYKAMDGRIWLLDNSYAMDKKDSHIIQHNSEFHHIEKQDGVSRWNELSQCVVFHTKMASRVWIPTQFRLLNESRGMPRKFTVCWGNQEDVKNERETIIENMNRVELKSKINPLAKHIRKLTRYLSNDAERLRERDEFVSIMICTQGVPTDEYGKRGTSVVKEFTESLKELAALPVRIVFRLTTDDDKVLDFFAALDGLPGVDVLDDYFGEASEVYLHNPWLTYGIGIHKMREAGLGLRTMDALDEQPYSLNEIREFCIEFFMSKKGLSIRNPNVDLNGFFKDLRIIVDREKPVWNPLKNKLCPWIDVEKLKLMTSRKSSSGSAMPKSFMRRSTIGMDPQGTKKLGGSDENIPRTTADRRKFSRSFTYSAESSFGKSTRVNVPATPSDTPPKDLQDAIKQWSKIAPGYQKMKPLDSLLVNAPKLFPPTNLFVESHEHFFKWKELSEDAFIGESGDGLKELLRRASRKSKLFFHPDKLPSDLTPSQSILFKAMWDLIQESEAITLA